MAGKHAEAEDDFDSEDVMQMPKLTLVPRRRTIGGRMVLAPGTGKPFKAVLTYEDGRTSEHPFQSLQEGEAFLRRQNAML